MSKNTYIKGKNNADNIDTRYGDILKTYIDYLKPRKYSPATIEAYSISLRNFFSFLAVNEIERLQDVSLAVLEKYQGTLLDRKYSNETIKNYLQHMELFFKFLENEGYIFSNPCSGLIRPKLPKKLMEVLTVREVEKLLAVPDVTTPDGIRDRAIMETAYSAALRKNELLSLSIFSLDQSTRTLRIIGKGSKERVVPVGRHAVFWIDKYLRHGREQLTKNIRKPENKAHAINETALWIGFIGRRINPVFLMQIISDYGKKAGIEKAVTIHALRRACATHMLQNGAHPVQIQKLLGHSSTQALSHYLRLTITDIKNMHRRSKAGR